LGAAPIGYKTNLLVMGPGQCAFMDFVKVGLPLVLVLGGGVHGAGRDVLGTVIDGAGAASYTPWIPAKNAIL